MDTHVRLQDIEITAFIWDLWKAVFSAVGYEPIKIEEIPQLRQFYGSKTWEVVAREGGQELATLPVSNMTIDESRTRRLDLHRTSLQALGTTEAHRCRAEYLGYQSYPAYRDEIESEDGFVYGRDGDEDKYGSGWEEGYATEVGIHADLSLDQDDEADEKVTLSFA